MAKITQNFNIKTQQLVNRIKKIKFGFNKPLYREMYEIDYSLDIEGILRNYPGHIKHSIFNKQAHYLIYNEVSKKGDFMGTFYTITPNELYINGYPVYEKASDEFKKEMYRLVAEHHQKSFQPRTVIR